MLEVLDAAKLADVMALLVERTSPKAPKSSPKARNARVVEQPLERPAVDPVPEVLGGVERLWADG